MPIFNHPVFDPRLGPVVHILQLNLATAIVILSIVRMTRPVPFTRGQVMGLTMGLKCITVIQYQLLTKHVRALRKYQNLAIFAVFNIIEVVTWPIALIFMFLGTAQVCVGSSCSLQKAAEALTVIISVVAIQPAISSTLDILYHREHNTTRGQEPILMK